MTIPKMLLTLALCTLVTVLSPFGATTVTMAQEVDGGAPELAGEAEAEPAAVPEVFSDEVAADGFADEEFAEDELVEEGLEGAGEEEGNGALDYTLMELVAFGGVVGYLIIALSFVAVALVVDDFLLLRRKVLMPPTELEELRGLVGEGRFQEVVDEDRSSFVGAMTSAGIVERSRGYDAMVKAMEDAADGLTGRLLRRIEYLNIIANVTPMLGLLGTVIGMVKCFNQISVAVGGVDPRLLAAGIFQALMTTVMGLIVAIPSLFAFSMFRNRVDSLAAEATECAEDIVAPLRPAEGGATPVARLSTASS